MRLIDSNILVLASYANEQQDACQNVICEGGTISTLALAETFTVLERVVSRSVAQDAVAAYLRSNVTILDVKVSHVFDAIKRAKKTGLKFFDLIHYTTAITAGCTEIVSYDKDFDGLELPRIEP